MNKVITNSVAIKKFLLAVLYNTSSPTFEFTYLNRKLTCRESLKIFYCEGQNFFQEEIERSSLKAFIDFLSRIEEQPITIEFKNERIKIHEATL